MDWSQLNRDVIAEFRANDGRVAMFGDRPVVILHTVGARSGRILEVPLVVVPEDERLLVYGTAAGSAKMPPWVFNLRANPHIEVELGSERFGAEVAELSEAEAAARVSAMAEEVSQFRDYVTSAAPRKIPVFQITRTS